MVFFQEFNKTFDVVKFDLKRSTQQNFVMNDLLEKEGFAQSPKNLLNKSTNCKQKKRKKKYNKEKEGKIKNNKIVK